MSSSNLPPSTEEAYRKKCIELRRRMQEVEENNDATRLRRARLVRGIKKMRIERAILLDNLAKRMRKNGTGGIFDDDSEDSTESPPTPQERPLRVKKPHRRLPDMSSPPPIPSAAPSANVQPTPSSEFGAQNDPFATAPAMISRYPLEDLLPPSKSSLNGRTSPTNPFELFSDVFIGEILQRNSTNNSEAAAQEASEIWASLPEHARLQWDEAAQYVKGNTERAKAAQEWKKTVGNRKPLSSSANKPIEVDDDDDVVMVDGSGPVER